MTTDVRELIHVIEEWRFGIPNIRHQGRWHATEHQERNLELAFKEFDRIKTGAASEPCAPQLADLSERIINTVLHSCTPIWNLSPEELAVMPAALSYEELEACHATA